MVGYGRYSTLNRNTQWRARLLPVGGPYTSSPELFQVAIAPDDPKFLVITTSDPSITTGQSTTGPILIWVSTDAGQNWDLAFDGASLTATETIRNIDVSIDYGGKRDIGFVTVDSSGVAGSHAQYFRTLIGIPGILRVKYVVFSGHGVRRGNHVPFHDTGIGRYRGRHSNVGRDYE
jgi:hypothetical protein